MKKFLCLLLFLETLFAFGQIYPPDYKKIGKVISNKKSSLYYPQLMERYLQGDSTFTDEECQYLYYGFTLQKAYNPYETNDSELRDYLKKDGLNDDECREAIVLAHKVLENNPFHFSSLNTLTYCYDQLDSMSALDRCQQQLRIMAVAIIKSGNGKDPSTAFYVNEVSHEYFLLSLFDLFPQGQSLSIEGNSAYDVLEVSENEYGLEKIYFNIDAFFGKR